MTAGHGSKLPLKRVAAIEALLSEATIGAAARRAGLGEKTLRRWLRDAAFAAALAAEQRRLFTTGVSALQAGLSDAVATLRSLLAPETPATTRVRAAAELVGLALRATSLVELERRVAALEAGAHGAAGWPFEPPTPQLPGGNGGAA